MMTNNRRDDTGCWKRKTRLEKILIGVSLLLAILAIVFLALFLVSKSQKSDTCLTPQCITAASKVLQFIDPSKDPCNNFYDFVCGTFNKKAYEFGYEEAADSMQIVVKNQINGLIGEDLDFKPPKSLELQRQFYQACIDENTIEEESGRIFNNLLGKIGGWPVTVGNTWNDNRFDWVNFTLKAAQSGMEYTQLISTSPYYADKILNETTVWIQGPDVKLANSDHKSFSEYLDYIVRIASLISNQSPERIRNELLSAVQFEATLQKIVSQIKKDENTPQDKVYTIRELQATYPKMHWLYFLNVLYGNHRTFNINSKVVVEYPRYFENLFQLVDRTTKRTLANYMVWKIVEQYVDVLPTEFRNLKRAYEEAKSSYDDGDDSEDELEVTDRVPENPLGTRREICLTLSRNVFAQVAEVAYIRKYVPEGIRTDLRQMIKNIKDELYQRVKNSDFLDEESKDFGLKKFDIIQEYLGGPPEVYDVEKMENLFGLESVKFDTPNAIEMMNKVAMADVDHLGRELLVKKSPISIYATSTVVNSYFTPDLQILILSPGMLQDGLLYDYKRPQYMNYGAYGGGIIGHEFMHGYSFMDGAVKVEWWSNKTLEQFWQKAKCVAEQYESYVKTLKHDNFNPNGNITLEENIGDLVGADLAYVAYQKWVKEHGAEQKLPGLNYTPNQLYWISLSMFMCRKPLKNTDFQPNYKIDSHGETSFRLISPAQNSKYFSKDFNCPVGSLMNPKEKCAIY